MKKIKGGKRENSGRKKIKNSITLQIKVPIDKVNEIKEYIKNLRK